MHFGGALLDAAVAGKAEMMKRALTSRDDNEVRLDPNFYRDDKFRGAPALFLAAKGGHLDAVNVLLETVGTRVNFAPNGATALFVAAAAGHAAVCAALLAKGASRDILDAKFGLTPLAAACDKGHVDVVRVLVDKKYDDEKRPSRQLEMFSFDDGLTLPLVACKENAEIQRLLIAAGAPLFERTGCSRCKQLTVVAIAGCAVCDSCSLEIVKLYEERMLPTYSKQTGVTFYNKHDPFFELTNFAEIKIAHRATGRAFRHTEAFFQAAKFFTTAPEVAERIRRAKTARECFDIAHEHHEQERPDWMQVRERWMLEALRMKFSQNLHAKRVLLATADYPLVEDSGPKDDFWGNGADGQGKNRLGVLLMQVRTELRQNHEAGKGEATG